MKDNQCEICTIRNYTEWWTLNSVWEKAVNKRYSNLCLNCFTELLNKDNTWFLKLRKYKKNNEY